MQQPSYKNQRFLTFKIFFWRFVLYPTHFFSTDKHIRPLTLKKKKESKGKEESLCRTQRKYI